MRKKVLILFTTLFMGMGLLSSCQKNNPKITVADQLIEVGQSIDPEVSFTPTDSIDAYTFTTENGTIISINNHIITGMAEGLATVTCQTVNTNVSTTFKVTVSAAQTNATMTAFNEAGTFENELEGWTLTGTTAEIMSVDTDGDRGEDDYQLKLWSDGLLDFTLSYTLVNLPIGSYTISFDIVGGNLSSVIATIDETEYSWLTGGVMISGTGYTKNFFFFEITEVQNVIFSIYFFAEEANIGWGFLDNVMIEAGDTRPVVGDQFKDYILNGSFESGTLENWTMSGTHAGTIEIKSNNPHSGSRNFDYWGNDQLGENFTVSQVIASVTAGSNYIAKVYVINGDDESKPLTSAFLFVSQGEATYQVAITVTGWNAGYIEYKIEDITLNGTDPVTIGVSFQPEGGKYWMQLDDIQLINIDELVS